MWKKAGFVVGTSLAAVLALAPLAHAEPAPEGAEDAEQVIKGDDPDTGLVNVGDLLNGVNVCPDLDLGLGLGVLGSGLGQVQDGDEGPLSCETNAQDDD